MAVCGFPTAYKSALKPQHITSSEDEQKKQIPRVIGMKKTGRRISPVAGLRVHHIHHNYENIYIYIK